ncbi:hypothetical protein BTVI_46926 [Pitangus sulphuratus]|nr:hypothetical protein BTVI_46926 [Pitangus sulphuratus]
MAASPAYGEEKGGSSSLGEPEYGHDPASGGIFSSDYKSGLSVSASMTVSPSPDPLAVSSSLAVTTQSWPDGNIPEAGSPPIMPGPRWQCPLIPDILAVSPTLAVPPDP